jgi:transposase
LRIQDRILFLILFFLSATLATWRFNSSIFEESFWACGQIQGGFEQDREGFPRHFATGVPLMRRHEIKDEDWERIKDLLPEQPGDPGVTAKDNRLFINAVLWIGKTGAPWRDMPERFGPWGSVWKRFDRWAKKGVWERVFESLQDPDLEWMILDSTVIRAHQHAAGAEKKRDTRRSGIGAFGRRIQHQNPHSGRRSGQPGRVHPDRWPRGGCHPGRTIDEGASGGRGNR